ncbi:hypothetical protein GCM10022403_083670 [Streptomyces coacervatus]|uniref:Uncharacterized protein n=1 Tax=Streptomyces coacervatus TaxID=647381 RepID=A0ABP7JAF0_9ACTN|nr:hypothetical protein [Streptomyces coacervatus]MDF2270279.1 hypothetical protein [Streptomyces coacervatus]
MKRVTPEDFRDLQKAARGYCRAVDSTRSRKRMDGSSTAARNGSALYGTDDVSDDVAQDAVLMFAKRLREIIVNCEVAAVWVATREPSAWQYVRRDGETIVVTRKAIQYWAVRDAAARNGYRLDAYARGVDAAPGVQLIRGVARADKLSTLASAPYLSGLGEIIFRTAWGDGSGYPALRSVLAIAEKATDLGRAGIMGRAAQELYGGPLNSSSKVQRAKDVALKEWRALTASLDAVREDLVYRGAGVGEID